MSQQRSDDRVCFGNVLSLVLPVVHGKGHPFYKEKERFVVLSFQVPPEGFPRTCYLDFYKNEKKYKERCKSHQILLEKAKFGGFITGTKNNQTKDRYVALLFTTFTAIISLKGYLADKPEHIISACRDVIKEYFGEFKTCRIQFEEYPQTEKQIFDKERTGCIILSLVTNRLSIFSETFFHLCLYSWPINCVHLGFKGCKVHLDVSSPAEHYGMYVFVCQNDEDLKQCALFNGFKIYDLISVGEKPITDSTPTEAFAPANLHRVLPNVAQFSLGDSLSTISISPMSHSANSSGSSVPSFSNKFVYDDYLTTTASPEPELEFDFDINNYVLKHQGELNRALRSQPNNGRTEEQRDESHSEETDIYNIGEHFDVWLKSRNPGRDTLKLAPQTRYRLCRRLNEKSCIVGQEEKDDWELLAADIGLTTDAITLIKATANKGLLSCPAVEIVFNHWQYMYNRYDVTDPMGKCPYACTKDGLITILGRLNRKRLIELITES